MSEAPAPGLITPGEEFSPGDRASRRWVHGASGSLSSTTVGERFSVIKPPRLRPGDAIGIISPSWGGAALFPYRVEQGVRQLRELGFPVKFGAHALNEHGWVSDTPEHRAQDIHDLFRDPDVRAIIAALGGDHSCHLLPHLDWELIRAHPTIFMGYSDVSVLNLAIRTMTGLVTFNGPALLTDFAEHPKMFEYTRRSVLRTLCEAEPVGPIEPAVWWTEEYRDWETQQDLERARWGQTSDGWSWLRGGTAEGPLIGGCIESLQHLRGTRFWPKWEGAILFLETSEEKPSPARVDGMLMDYENMGVFEQINGLLFGRAAYYSDTEKAQLRGIILERTKQYSIPVITGMDFGHTAPQFVLPIGVRARINADEQRFEIVEAAVA